MSDVSLGKSSRHSFSPKQLRMISSDGESLQNAQAPIPSRMEVNSGKSTLHSHSAVFTLKYRTRALVEGAVPHNDRLQLETV